MNIKEHLLNHDIRFAKIRQYLGFSLDIRQNFQESGGRFRLQLQMKPKAEAASSKLAKSKAT
jgi:hypothetical protein